MDRLRADSASMPVGRHRVSPGVQVDQHAMYSRAVPLYPGSYLPNMVVTTASDSLCATLTASNHPFFCCLPTEIPQHLSSIEPRKNRQDDPRDLLIARPAARDGCDQPDQ